MTLTLTLKNIKAYADFQGKKIFMFIMQFNEIIQDMGVIVDTKLFKKYIQKINTTGFRNIDSIFRNSNEMQILLDILAEVLQPWEFVDFDAINKMHRHLDKMAQKISFL